MDQPMNETNHQSMNETNHGAANYHYLCKGLVRTPETTANQGVRAAHPLESAPVKSQKVHGARGKSSRCHRLAGVLLPPRVGHGDATGIAWALGGGHPTNPKKTSVLQIDVESGQ
jgi:hypothetical protein